MANTGVIHLLRVVHIVGATFWVGSILFMGRFLIPAISGAGPAGGAVMDQIARVQKLPVYLHICGLLTVLSGIGLYSIDSMGFQKAWIMSGPGLGFGIGGILAVIGWTLGMTVNAPLAKAIGMKMQEAAGKPNAQQAAEIAALQTRLATFSKIGGFLAVGALIAMAVARYLP